MNVPADGLGSLQSWFYEYTLARRYVFYPDEIAEAEAQGLPYILVPREFALIRARVYRPVYAGE